MTLETMGGLSLFKLLIVLTLFSACGSESQKQSLEFINSDPGSRRSAETEAIPLSLKIESQMDSTGALSHQLIFQMEDLPLSSGFRPSLNFGEVLILEVGEENFEVVLFNGQFRGQWDVSENLFLSDIRLKQTSENLIFALPELTPPSLASDSMPKNLQLRQITCDSPELSWSIAGISQINSDRQIDISVDIDGTQKLYEELNDDGLWENGDALSISNLFSDFDIFFSSTAEITIKRLLKPFDLEVQNQDKFVVRSSIEHSLRQEYNLINTGDCE